MNKGGMARRGPLKPALTVHRRLIQAQSRAAPNVNDHTQRSAHRLKDKIGERKARKDFVVAQGVALAKSLQGE